MSGGAEEHRQPQGPRGMKKKIKASLFKMFNKKHGNKHGIGTMHVLEKYICKCISQNKLYIHWSAAGYEASGIVWLEQPEVLLVRSLAPARRVRLCLRSSGGSTTSS